ncbi:MAG: TerB family tellurite resistance protein [Crocinitomix sp.]|nr:TerB family tellurite resistance protein [Crocinitomix sp.]
MTAAERLFEVFGELLYAIAMADGLIQDEELTALEEIVENHPWSTAVKWSFNYEKTKAHNVEEVYNKVINFCHQHGPSPHYTDFISAMEKVAAAANGTEDSETKIIQSFSADLTARFQEDLDKKSR